LIPEIRLVAGTEHGHPFYAFKGNALMESIIIYFAFFLALVWLLAVMLSVLNTLLLLSGLPGFLIRCYNFTLKLPKIAFNRVRLFLNVHGLRVSRSNQVTS